AFICHENLVHVPAKDKRDPSLPLPAPGPMMNRGAEARRAKVPSRDREGAVGRPRSLAVAARTRRGSLPFALLGHPPDGVAMAGAVVDSGRHRLPAYTAPAGEEVVRRWGPAARRVADVEEILADPAVEAVLVAGSPAARPEQLRRALQSERHVLCVFPPD